MFVITMPGNYTVTVSNASGCTATATASVVNATTSMLTWTGTTSTDWNTASNWCPTRVPLSTDDVVIPSTPANQPVLSTPATAKSVEVQSGASLSITAAGILTINGSKSVGGNATAFHNGGTVANSGQLVVGNTAAVGDYGIFNVATFINNAGGTISIDRATVVGLENNIGSFTNSGTMRVGAVALAGNYGIDNRATFTNNAGGAISIDQATLEGLLNFRGSFTNSATITIGASAAVGATGVDNRATFSNAGCGALLNIVANAVISNSSSFSNTGTIIENATGNSSISTNAGLVQNLNGGTFTIGTNTGVLTTTPGSQPTITATPSLTITQGQSATLTASGATSYSWSTGETTAAISVSVAGPYSVTGTIGSCSSVTSVTLTVNTPVCGAGLSGPIWTGCVSTDWNTAGNWASGTVPTATDDVVIPSGPANQPVLSTTATAKSVAVQTGASLSISSAGSLTINSFATLGGFPTAFYNQGTVNNNGTLMLGNTAPVGLIGLHNTGTFTNTGTLQVDRATNQGINNRATATFTNTGIITIGASVTMGTQGIWNQATFTNTGGTITIDRITGDGLLNSGNFINSATITIGASASVTGNGLTNSPGASFTNATGGTITIDRTGVLGLANTFTATFINYSTITIGSLGTIGNYGIVNPGMFTNSACATLTLLAPIFNNGNSFTNAGLFTVNTTRTHIDFGTLTNNGIIDYPQGNPIPNVVNNDVIASAISSCGNTINPALQLGDNSNQFTVGTTWYSDQALTQPAGTYNQGTNTFTATNLAPGSSTLLYFSATDNTNNCTKTVSVSVTVNQSVTAVISPSSATLTCTSPTVSLTASGGSNYVWEDGSINAVRTVSSSAIYSVTVSSGAGCSATASVGISQDNLTPSASLASSGTLSCAVTSVTLTANPNGLSYQFSQGATQLGSTNQATVSAPGLYSVTVISGNGCTGVASVSVSQDNTKPVATLSASPSTTLTCTQTQITLFAGGGDRYVFTGPGIVSQEGSQALVNTAGVYSVTVTNSSTGCFSVTTITISQDKSVPQASLTSSGLITCATSSVTLTASPNGLSYAFAGPGVVSQNGNQAIVNASGTYSVTVSNGANGCSAVAQTTVTGDQSVPEVSLTNDGPLSCTMRTVTLTASPQGQSYRFSAGATQVGSGNTATLNTAGTYSVTVTSGNGCSAVAQTTVTGDQTAPSVSITANPSLTITQGQSATLTASGGAGQPAVTYAWNNGANTPAIVVSTAGPYSVTGTSANGCTGTASVTLTVNPVVTAPFAITGVTTVDCTPVLPNRFSVSFTPRYSGLDGSPLSFSVTNELFPTTSPGPYTLQLYTDNPVITLEARQGGATTKYTYDWLAACNSSTTPNTPPRVVRGIPSQTATVGQYFSYVIPEGTFTDTETPGSLRLSASGLPGGLNFSGATLSGTPSSTVGSPVSITITATDPGGLSASTPLVLSVQPAMGTPPPTAPFAITGVTTISCTPVADRININFTPRYAGLNGQPVAFEVVNELGSTTEPGPYSLTLYRDNPVITLRATQTGSAGPVTYAYNWLNACQSVGQDNTPPRLNEPVASQTALVGQGYSLNLTNTFIDQETPDQISLSAAGLPAGLTVSGKFISGTPSMSGVSSVTLTATDGGGLSTSTVFSFTVLPASPQPPTNPPTAPFSITGVTTVSCEVISAGERRVTFSPRYAGLDGSPVRFRVVNETLPTTASGPYTLNLYTDNPVITLEAVQSGVVSQFRYGWLAACNPGARQAALVEAPLRVIVLGNPVVGETIEVEVRGAQGQALRLQLSDERGHRVSEQSVGKAGEVERLTLRLGQLPAGVLLLRVSTSTQSQTLKLIKTE
ncbi:beta strand repeat-containing protein [Spirosoma spitsbergense]|uniref:beta strand repeat-containing protein n=1 Tax=Spirosoma spitsbergense TaxID=431554 RepID=UPI0003A206D8|nr:putative Ig domain-containing protein [Spirosoma spitsbergense]